MIENQIIAIILFFFLCGLLIGFWLGWLSNDAYRDYLLRRVNVEYIPFLQKMTIGNFLLVSIMLMIMATVFYEMINPSYQANPLLYTALGAIAGMVLVGKKGVEK